MDDRELKESINIAIEKFNTAYKPVEINDSKMKEIYMGLMSMSDNMVILFKMGVNDLNKHH